MLAVSLCLLFIERFGRRPLLLSMAVAQSVAFLGIAISTAISSTSNPQASPPKNQSTHHHTPGILATGFITLFFLSFGTSWCPIPWLYPAEINSLSLRTKGAALATAADWLFNYLVVQTTPLGIHYLKWGIYLVYALLNAGFVPLVWVFVVETRGRSLEEIERWFDGEGGRGWVVRPLREMGGWWWAGRGWGGWGWRRGKDSGYGKLGARGHDIPSEETTGMLNGGPALVVAGASSRRDTKAVHRGDVSEMQESPVSTTSSPILARGDAAAAVAPWAVGDDDDDEGHTYS